MLFHRCSTNTCKMSVSIPTQAVIFKIFNNIYGRSLDR